MTLLELLDKTTAFFASKGLESPRLQVELLIANLLNKPRLSLYLEHDRPMTESELDRLRPLVKRRASGEPVQYILGTTHFCGLELKVTPAVLIPRPETEWLVDLVLQEWSASPETTPATVADLGTGSGAIALALAAGLPGAIILATDFSAEALEIARENAALHPELSVQFYQGDLLAPLPHPPEAIVANLPYLTEAEMQALPPDVQAEPATALAGGKDGLDLVHRLLDSIPDETVFIALELGLGQPEMVEAALSGQGWHGTIHADPSGRDRYYLARRDR
jgi:release factor glutamine methyltransferase